MTLTEEQLKKLLPSNKNASKWLSSLNLILPKYEINTPKRIASFFAQCAHESMDFNVVKENLNYKALRLMEIFPKYFTTIELANQYAGQPEKIANRVYGNRMGNGPESSGDGYRYCGRGLIQITGKNNYQKFSESIKLSMIDTVHYLETDNGALESACWFWKERNLNKYADDGDNIKITELVNGGRNGLDDRLKRYNAAMNILNSLT